MVGRFSASRVKQFTDAKEYGAWLVGEGGKAEVLSIAYKPDGLQVTYRERR